jgi:uroporphyrinogen-III synthase
MEADGPAVLTLPLQGLTLVVTRPAAQARRTVMALRKAGATAIEFPVLDIAPIDAILGAQDLATASAFIFVSANAVEYGVPAVRRAGEFPPVAEIFAIGRATATALNDAGFPIVVSPQQTIDSEGLLALPQLRTVMGRHIILVKGQSELGGRTLLEQTLTARGAQVTALECYRRAPLMPDLAKRETLRQLVAVGDVHAFFAMSAETLESLMNVFSTMDVSLQSKVTLLVPHARVAKVGQAYGFERIEEVPMADSALVERLAALKVGLLAPIGSPLVR